MKHAKIYQDSQTVLKENSKRWLLDCQQGHNLLEGGGKSFCLFTRCLLLEARYLGKKPVALAKIWRRIEAPKSALFNGRIEWQDRFNGSKPRRRCELLEETPGFTKKRKDQKQEGPMRTKTKR